MAVKMFPSCNKHNQVHQKSTEKGDAILRVRNRGIKRRGSNHQHDSLLGYHSPITKGKNEDANDTE